MTRLLIVFSGYSFLDEWPQTRAVYLPQLMELGLADENYSAKGAAHGHRKPQWKVALPLP